MNVTGNIGLSEIERQQLSEKKLHLQQEMYNISPACSQSYFRNNRKQIWRILFSSLFAAIIVYYTIFQITIGTIFTSSSYVIDSQTMAFAILLAMMIFFAILGIAAKAKSFPVTYIIVIILVGGIISVSGVLILFTTLVPDMQGADMVKIFVILFPTNILISVACFYITRKIVCRVPNT